MMIHALSVLDGILAISPLPGSGGDFPGDMEHVTEWRPAMVITLVTRAELEAAGAAALGIHVEDHGSRWVHLPIPDFGTPPDEMLRRWPEVSAQARQALSGGGRVLVHCRGGCGRSGMVALRLMIEAGEATDEALARLRHLRPCAVETEAQMGWALQAPRCAALFLRHVD
ncbi:protein-tyrosine phosphatase family protein [Salipiger mangrovisoli]|uniref:Dual specificity protein phosphatase family protein n=1 Tax=Salipiger mangrovisoli TaxID=2865933 RepID=A0ABR9X469_9RHOB|nr:dual specificity protein phosphatase family protein [Salipiger mangrovisoli]MBE9638242.1 dual specificity protein phosphatase family protein [Salipiger mangrovisoli]